MRGVAAVFGAAAALAGAASAQDLSARDTTCYSGVYVIYARGTYEPQNFSLSNSVANAIVAAIPGSAAMQVQYPANTSSFSSTLGIQDAVKRITDYGTACPSSKMVLMGYSQGARVMDGALAPGNESAIPQSIGKNVVALVQWGDPMRVLGQGIESAPSPCNVSATNARKGTAYDQMQFYADRLDDWCAYGDPVCCATGNDYGQHLSYFTNDNAAQIAKYVSGKFSAAGSEGAASGTVTASAVKPSRTAACSKAKSSSSRPTGTATATSSAPTASFTGAASSNILNAGLVTAQLALLAAGFLA